MDYQKALETAEESATAAGAILRRHFHQPAGPGGPRGKAPGDLEAEHDIRARLLRAFPDWGYRGEETGEAGLDAAPSHVWMVDPNDGTEAYQRGRRGPSVAIGLLCEGRPVLGVVYSHGFPDDRGDLLYWAEGCGPLKRNGREVTRPPWPTKLSADGILLLSPGNANHKVSRVIAVSGPTRLRGLSSIAYRLALTAAGEAVAAVSLHSPCGWDYAAAHALLHATGGELLDGDGRPVTYGPTGESLARFCFGGAPDVVAELAARDWRPVIGPPGPVREVYDLVEPRPGIALEDFQLLSRAQGCLLGQIGGDALGGQVEFSSAPGQQITAMRDGGYWGTLAGQPTDDSEMALILGRSILRHGGYSPDAARQAYAWWFESHPFDCGNTVGTALQGAPNPESQANGSLMRISPLGIWGHAQPAEQLAEHARADARLTHPHPVCQDAAAVYAVAVAGAVSGVEPVKCYERACAQAREDAVRQVLAAAAGAPPEDYRKNIGWVLIALHNAFYQLLHAPSAAAGIIATVAAGGDTDTNAAIAGALLGAVHGRDSLPVQWRDQILSCRPQSGLAHVKQPRPRAFWPVDVLDLAERLAVLGATARHP